MPKYLSTLKEFQKDYLFAETEKKKKDFLALHPHADLINLGIGDIAEPISPYFIKKIYKAAKELSKKNAFKGYPPNTGYDFLKETIQKEEYSHTSVKPDEIFISSGIKQDLCYLADLFSKENLVGIQSPSYPVYLDTSKFSGKKTFFLFCKKEQNFSPEIPSFPLDIIFLCSPNNPTGTALTKKELKKWVDYAKEHQALIIFDAAYAAYIQSKEVPKTIYEIPGADEVAVELKSFSKTAGFTNLRIGYTVIPKKLSYFYQNRPLSLNAVWKRVRDTKTGGIPYPIQKAAESAYSKKGKKIIKKFIETIHFNAKTLKNALEEKNLNVYGGTDSPYLWIETSDSVSFFEKLLTQTEILCIPGIGFGDKHFVRFSSFIKKEHLSEILKRLKNL